MNTGRTPIREAAQRLAAAHLLQIVPRHGIVISVPNIQDQILGVTLRSVQFSGYSDLDCVRPCGLPPINIGFKSNGWCLGAKPALPGLTIRPTGIRK
ncbi:MULTISPECIES: GntR family transcriptional regulator [Burkholderia cepacia complex]|uniref:GntR family transcriptional regulator n=1 Tax=Burkholderia stagnalis TaxID=1503054 RepID=UPI001F4936EE